MRGSVGGLKYVKGLGFEVDGQAQVLLKYSVRRAVARVGWQTRVHGTDALVFAELGTVAARDAHASGGGWAAASAGDHECAICDRAAKAAAAAAIGIAS